MSVEVCDVQVCEVVGVRFYEHWSQRPEVITLGVSSGGRWIQVQQAGDALCMAQAVDSNFERWNREGMWVESHVYVDRIQMAFLHRNFLEQFA